MKLFAFAAEYFFYFYARFFRSEYKSELCCN